MPRSYADILSPCEVASDVGRYSGKEPQILPFPPELVVRILSYLDKAHDKRDARLVCKGFAAAGLSSLTSTVYFSTSRIGIDFSSATPHFSSPSLEIAMHPVVSKYITTLFCEGTQISTSYIHFREFRPWWASLHRRTSWPVEILYNLYTTRYYQELWMTRLCEDQRIFSRALENFPKLDCVVFRDLTLNGDRDWPRTNWPSAVPRGDLWSPTSPYHSFAACIRSLSGKRIKLRELHIVGSEYGIAHRIFSPASHQDYNHLLNVFANLCKVSVNVNAHLDTSPLSFAGLGRVVTYATQLQSLDLKSHGDIVRLSPLIMSRVFQDFTWPHLKHLGLSGFKLHTDMGLIAFFYRHRATIDSVTLRFMFLHHTELGSTDNTPCEAWKHFFGELRRLSIKFQNLQLSRIHDCCNCARDGNELQTRAEGGRRVLRYLHHGGPNPLEFVPINDPDGCTEMHATSN